LLREGQQATVLPGAAETIDKEMDQQRAAYVHSKREKIMSTFYKKATLIFAAAAAGTVLCAMPISVERSAISGIVLSIDQAQARVGQPGTAVSVAGVNRRHRRADRRCATGVTC
jgi:hypothetical protein